MVCIFKITKWSVIKSHLDAYVSLPIFATVFSKKSRQYNILFWRVAVMLLFQKLFPCPNLAELYAGNDIASFKSCVYFYFLYLGLFCETTGKVNRRLTYQKFRTTFPKSYQPHFNFVSKYNFTFSTRLSKPEFYVELVYKFRKSNCKKIGLILLNG